MMDFWPENQGHSHLYSKFGTVPGRNCTHNYHDRHQGTHYPLYYSEQQDPGREASYWTVPGSRTGGSLHEYTNWTDPELTAPSSSSSHFPFILDRHTQQHQQDLGEYQPPEAREWTTAPRASRDYERGFLREGWQRRWEPCSPVRYNREVSAKRSDSSYRELEAWAARYSHSLPRRRRIEAELRGASQGLGESSRAPERDTRSGTDVQVAALQHVRQSANSRESGLWDRGGRQQALTYYPSQAPAPDTTHMSYQRRIFSQPPGYIAPPPYNSPHKSSPVVHQCDTSWEQDSKKQTSWSRPTLRKQEVSVDLQDTKKGKKDEYDKSDESKSCPEPEGLKTQRQEADVLQAGSPISVQNIHNQHERMLSLQHPQEVQNSEIIKETSSKVIEGRKFRLNKKTGGMTIFCLVSRIAGTTETPSLPVSQTVPQSTELGEVSKGLRDRGEVHQMHKLADEVDNRGPTLTEQANTSDGRNLFAREEETQTCMEKEIIGDDLPNKAEADIVSPEKANTNDDSAFGRHAGQSAQPVSVKYPLWREPSFTSRAETAACSLKVNTEEESDGDDCVNVSSRPIDIEVRRLDIKEDTEDSNSLLVIDTTCVVVKMELIPSPKKEHVHYLDSTALAEDSLLDCQLNQDQTTEAAPLQLNEDPETDLDSLTPIEKDEHKAESEIPCIPSSPVSERETLEERAERILGIPLLDRITEQQPEDVMSFLDSCVEEQDEETESKQTPEETTEEEQSKNHLEVVPIEDAGCLTDGDGPRDQVTGEDGEEVLDMFEENETDVKTSAEIEMTADPMLESTGEKGTIEQDQEENQPVEDDQSSQPPDLFKSSEPKPSDLTSPPCILQSNTEEGPDPELTALNTSANLTPHPETSSLPHTPLHQLTSPLPPESTDSSPSSTPHTDRSPSPLPPVDFIDQTPETTSAAEDQDEEGEAHLTENEVSNAVDMTEETVSPQQLECGRPDEAACVADKQQTKDEQPAEGLEQELEASTEKATDVDILQLECVQSDDVAGLNEPILTEEQPLEEVSEDPAGFSVQTSETDEENVTDEQTEVFQFDSGQEKDVLCAEESCMAEDQSQNNPDELPAGLWEQTICENNPADSQAEIWQDTEPRTEPSDCSPPSASDCEVSRSSLEEHSLSEPPSPPHASHESDTECVSLLDVDSVCPSPLNPDAAAGITETVLSPPLHLDSCAESCECSSSSVSEVLPLSSSPPPPPQEENVSPDVPTPDAHKAEPQYPKSLWDVVNRIRKHTAPDSENEEEEVSELWDPENSGEDLQDVVMGITSENVFEEEEEPEVLEDSVEMGQIQQDHKEPSGHTDEDTLSCSSNSSHSSGDTVIIADEDEVEETTPDVVTEIKTENKHEEFNTAEGELLCSDEEEHETGENEEEQQDEVESCQSEECPAEVENTTSGAVEVMETHAL